MVRYSAYVNILLLKFSPSEMALIVNSIKDSLQNDDREKLSDIRDFCLDKIKNALSKCGKEIPKFERDAFGTSCIPEAVKRAVFDGMDQSNKIVVAGR